MSTSEMYQLNDIALKVGRLEVLQEANTKAIAEMTSGVNRLVEKLDKSDDIAREADQRARSAQHQINDLKQSLKWVIGTAISFAGVMIAALGFLWKVVAG
jgi:methyl-accepting chemotaxis protein